MGHWKRRAERAQEAHRRLHETARARTRVKGGYEAWEQAVLEYQVVMVTTYPPEFEAALDVLRRGEKADREPILEFLEADPYFPTSGYVKADCLRWLKRFDLTEAEKERVRDIILAYISRPVWLQEAKYYGRLAPKVDSPAFRAWLEHLLIKGTVTEQERAAHILEILGGVWSEKYKAIFRRRLLRAIRLPELPQEFAYCLKFARRVNAPELRAELRRLTRKGEDFQQVRAGRVLAALGERSRESVPSEE